MENLKTKKSWGTSVRLFQSDHIKIEAIYVQKGGFSSIHHHSDMSNQFSVISGTLVVRTYKKEDANKLSGFSSIPSSDEENYGILTDPGICIETVTLEPGQSCVIPSTAPHSFEALTDVVAIEIYESQKIAEDIFRYTLGGKSRG